MMALSGDPRTLISNDITAEARLSELKAEAIEEGATVSQSSEQDLRHFLHLYRHVRCPAIALLDNGNFRVQWRNPNCEQISLQFRGKEEVQFVFFVRRADILASSAGRDSFKGIVTRLKADRLLDMVTG